MATNLNQKKRFDRFSRLRFYDIVTDERLRKYRIGMKDRNFINNIIQQVEWQNWKIPTKWEFRPDLISNFFYGTPKLWWLLQEYNQFFRMPQDFYADRVIKVPDSNQVVSLLL